MKKTAQEWHTALINTNTLIQIRFKRENTNFAYISPVALLHKANMMHVHVAPKTRAFARNELRNFQYSVHSNIYIERKGYETKRHHNKRLHHHFCCIRILH